MEVGSREWEEWMAHPVTRAFILHLKQRRWLALEDWGRGAFMGEVPDATLQANARALGQVEILDTLSRITFEDILATRKEVHDTQQFRYSPDGITGLSPDGPSSDAPRGDRDDG